MLRFGTVPQSLRLGLDLIIDFKKSGNAWKKDLSNMTLRDCFMFFLIIYVAYSLSSPSYIVYV